MPDEALTLANEMLRQGAFDTQEMGWIVGIAQRFWPDYTEAQLRDIVVSTIRYLLTEGLGEMRDYQRGQVPEWTPWQLTPDQRLRASLALGTASGDRPSS